MKPTILNRIRAQASAIAKSDLRTRVTWAFYLLACTAMLTSPAFGQTQGDDPWSKAASNLAGAVTGPIAKGLSMVSIVAGGLGMAFGEGQAKKTIAEILGSHLEVYGKDIEDGRKRLVQVTMAPAKYPNIRIEFTERLPKAGGKCKIVKCGGKRVRERVSYHLECEV